MRPAGIASAGRFNSARPPLRDNQNQNPLAIAAARGNHPLAAAAGNLILIDARFSPRLSRHRPLRETRVGILLVEQNAKQSLAIADRGYLLENGPITGEDSAANLADDPSVQAAYLGVASPA